MQPQQLKTINPPGGGTIVYGQVAGQTTEAGAMGAVLRSVHQSVGEKPQVGKLFQVHGTESVAAFFSATRRNGNGGQVAGIIIATKVSSDIDEAALITDEATRFHRPFQANMNILFAAWHPLRDAAASSAPSGPAGSVATLHQQVLPDRSASVGLPDNWRVAPNASGGGTIVAVGPDGENAFLGVAFQAMDTNNPAVQQTMRQLQAGRLQSTQYARAAYIPYGADMQKTFVFLFNKARDRAGNPPADFTFSTFSPMQGNGREHCAHLAGTVDFKDQKGTREMNGVYCVDPPGPMGTYMTLVYITTVPMSLAAKDRATLGAILESFNVNMGVVMLSLRKSPHPRSVGFTPSAPLRPHRRRLPMNAMTFRTVAFTSTGTALIVVARSLRTISSATAPSLTSRTTPMAPFGMRCRRPRRRATPTGSNTLTPQLLERHRLLDPKIGTGALSQIPDSSFSASSPNVHPTAQASPGSDARQVQGRSEEHC